MRVRPRTLVLFAIAAALPGAAASPAHALATLDSPTLVGDVAYSSSATTGVDLSVYKASAYLTFSADEFIIGEGDCSVLDNKGSCPSEGVDDVFVGMGSGPDTVDLGGLTTAKALVRLGPGGDELTGGPLADTISAGDGDDTVHGSGGGDTIADAGYSALAGGTGTGVDAFHGGEGNDAFVQGAYATTDTITGGPGRDRVDYSERTERVTVVPEGTTADGQAGEGDLVSGVEDAYGGSGDDDLRGGDSMNLLVGGAGGDHLRGGAGADTLRGGTIIGGPGSGDDVLDGGPGADVLVPGDGIDTLSHRSQPDGVKVTIDGLPNDGGAIGGENVPYGFEIIEGGAGPDELVGAASGSDDLRGLEGTDRLIGSGGDDTLDPGPGADEADGESGDDRLLARDGEIDTIACGSGSGDVAVVDAADVVAADCETVERDGATPPPASPGAETSPAAPGAVDGAPATEAPVTTATATNPAATARPLLRLRGRRLRVDRHGRVRVSLECAAGADCRGRLVLKLRGRNRGAARFALTAGSRRVVRLKLRGGLPRRMSRATLKATVDGGTGATARLRLRRRS